MTHHGPPVCLACGEYTIAELCPRRYLTRHDCARKRRVIQALVAEGYEGYLTWPMFRRALERADRPGRWGHLR